MLLREGSSQEALWGINLYREMEDDDFLEFDSLINIRPRQGNRSRDVENEEIRERIRQMSTNIWHRTMENSRLNDERWKSISFVEQMANIGSEVGRTAKWVQKAKPAMAESAFVRALELIDLTIKYGRHDSPYRGTMLKRAMPDQRILLQCLRNVRHRHPQMA